MSVVGSFRLLRFGNTWAIWLRHLGNNLNTRIAQTEVTISAGAMRERMAFTVPFTDASPVYGLVQIYHFTDQVLGFLQSVFRFLGFANSACRLLRQHIGIFPPRLILSYP